MPMIRSLYPKEWDSIASRIKNEASWRCQNCGKECRRSRETVSDFIGRVGDPSGEILAHPQRFTLTVAHLNHTPADCSDANLRAWCAPCHLRYDGAHRKAKRNAAIAGTHSSKCGQIKSHNC
jgi:hypothetical protein